jgi:hypothetical protein
MILLGCITRETRGAQETREEDKYERESISEECLETKMPKIMGRTTNGPRNTNLILLKNWAQGAYKGGVELLQSWGGC